MAKVYVPQLSMRFDRAAGRQVLSRDVSDARRFGEVVQLLEPTGSSLPPDPAATVAALHAGLASFGPDDYMVTGLGHPVVLAWATAIAADRCGGKLRLLHWDRGGNCYVPVEANLYAEVPARCAA